MPEPRKVIRYTLDAALIFAPLSGMLYFLFDPAAFNAFLAWLVAFFRGGLSQLAARGLVADFWLCPAKPPGSYSA